MLLAITQHAVLICHIDRKKRFLNSDQVTFAENPMTCLNLAVDGNFELIVIDFAIRQIRVRSGLLDLCRCLKENASTRGLPLLVIMNALHRTMAVGLRQAGVEFLKVHTNDKPIDPDRLMDLVRQGHASVRIGRIIDRLCPFLNYRAVDDQREIVTCRAYRNRMVLGGRRLHEVCETEGHLFCPWFLNSGMKP